MLDRDGIRELIRVSAGRKKRRKERVVGDRAVSEMEMEMGMEIGNRNQRGGMEMDGEWR